MQASYRQKCKFTSLLAGAICCCLQTCNRCFVMRVIWCTSVPSFICRKASTRVLIIIIVNEKNLRIVGCVI